MWMLMVTLPLVSCARRVWYKQGADKADYNRDAYSCERDARQSGYFGTGYVGAANFADFYERCMVAHGWERRQVDDAGNFTTRRERRTASSVRPDAEALEEERRTSEQLRRRGSTSQVPAKESSGQAQKEAGKPMMGRCTEDELRAMLRREMSASAINSACYE